MNAPKTRSAAIAAFCKQCIYDRHADGTWLEQVSVCGTVNCPLWRLRPVSRTAPAWIKSHDPADLPEGWLTLANRRPGDAIRALRQTKQENPASVGVETTIASDPLPTPCLHCKVPKSAVFNGTAEGAP